MRSIRCRRSQVLLHTKASSSYRKIKRVVAQRIALNSCIPVREAFEPPFPAAPVAALEPVEDAEVDVAFVDVPEEVTLPEVPDTPEGRMPDVTLTDAEVVIETDVAPELEVGAGSVRVTPVVGKLTLVARSVVWCGGSV